MSDRILVLHEGRITAEIARDRGDRGAGDVRRDRQRRRRAGRWRRRSSDADRRSRGRGPDRPASTRGWLARRPAARAEPRRDHGRARRAGRRRRAAVPDPSNLKQVAVLASITAVAAVGQALVIITRNIDLSVEATIGLVAYCVADRPRAAHARRRRAPSSSGSASASSSGMVNGVRRHGPARAVDRGDARHAQHLPRHRLPHRRQPPGAARRPAARVHRPRPRRRPRASRSSSSSRSSSWSSGRSSCARTRFGRQVYAVGSNPEAAAVLGIPSRLVVFAAFALCGLLAGVAGVMWVIEFGTINGTSATGVVLPGRRRRRRRRRQHLRRVRHGRRRGDRRAVPRVHRERADPRRPVAVLAAGDLRRRDPRRGQRRRRSSCGGSSALAADGAPDERTTANSAPRPPRRGPARSRAGRRSSSSRSSG